MSSRVVFKFLLCIDDISQPHAQRAPRKSGTMRFVREKLQYSVSIHVKNLTSLSSVRAGALVRGVGCCCKIPQKPFFACGFFVRASRHRVGFY